MDASEAAVLGFTAAMIAVSLVLIAVRSARRPKSAPKMPAASARIQERVFEPIEELPEEEPTAEPVPVETWTILKNDQEIGPVKFDELEVYARQGLVKDNELLKASNSKRWVRARDIPGLSFASASPAVAASGSSSAPARTRSAAPDLTISSLNIPNLDIALSPRERPAGPVAQAASAPSAPRRTARRRDLRDPIRPAPPRIAEPITSEAAEPRKRGYLVRSWRGDLRLGVSFWVNGLLVGTLAAAFASAAWDMPESRGVAGATIRPSGAGCAVDGGGPPCAVARGRSLAVGIERPGAESRTLLGKTCQGRNRAGAGAATCRPGVDERGATAHRLLTGVARRYDDNSLRAAARARRPRDRAHRPDQRQRRQGLRADAGREPHAQARASRLAGRRQPRGPRDRQAHPGAQSRDARHR